MEIFTPLKILLVILTTFIVMLLANQYAKSDDISGGRIKPYREFCIENSTKKQLPCYF